LNGSDGFLVSIEKTDTIGANAQVPLEVTSGAGVEFIVHVIKYQTGYLLTGPLGHRLRAPAGGHAGTRMLMPLNSPVAPPISRAEKGVHDEGGFSLPKP